MFEQNLPQICADFNEDHIIFSLLPGLPVDDTIIGTTYTFKAKTTSVGTYKVRIVATDPAGATDTLLIDLSVNSSSVVDETPPTINLVTPPKDSVIVTTPTSLIDLISSDASGVASVTATFNGITLPLQLVSGHYTVTIAELKAGEYNKIEVVATDASPAGNKHPRIVYIKYNPVLTIKYDGNGNTGGTVPVDSANYQAGAIVTVKANTNSLEKTDSTFAGWNTKDDGSGKLYAPADTFSIGTSHVLLYAMWTAKTTYVLTVSATNGSVTKSPNLLAYDSGTVVTLTPVPAAGYHFNGWSGALTGSTDPGTVIMNGAKLVTAVFEANLQNSFALAVLATNGTVKKTPDLPQYDSGSTVGLKATASAGYRFVNWSGDAAGETDSTTVLLTAAKSVTANFAKLSYQLTVSAGTGGTITAPVTSQDSVDHGVATTITAAPSSGYAFANWMVTTGTATITDATSPSTTVKLTSGNAQVTANFTPVPYELTVSAGTGGTITTPVTSPAIVNFGVATTITATPSPGLKFVNWTVTTGTATITGATLPSTTVKLTTGNATVSANFAPLTYTLTVSSGIGGTILVPTPSPQVSVNHGVATTIAASPSSGYTFVNWTVTGTGTVASATSLSTTVTLTGNATVTANWVVTTFTVTYSGNGNTSGNAPSDVTKYTNGMAAIIRANPGKLMKSDDSFIGWNTLPNGTGTTYSCGQTITITGNVSLHAKYSNISVMDNDGNLYTSIPVGTQRWLVQNLKTTKYNDNSEIPLVTDPTAWEGVAAPAYCWPENDINNKQYGAYYNGYSVNTGKLAPAGWHVPTLEEWETLLAAIGDDPACQLKETGTTHWSDNDCANNYSGFTAFGRGTRNTDGEFLTSS